MSDSPKIPRLIAILIGISKYNHFPHLKSAALDAAILNTFLTKEFHANPEDITLLIDSAATRDEIIDKLDSLKETPERDNAILFFFSGYDGKAQSEEDNAVVGMICPVDMNDVEDEIPGIPDKTLIQLFDNISRARGNNITVFLDCASPTFTWGYPKSFVVVAPKSATETKGGGTFTKSLINVLRSEKNLIQLLTVQSFADKIQADMGQDVHCYGQNIDRLLFNPMKGKAYHAFISGKTVQGGGIMLAAGSAHGVQKGATYGIYRSNVQANKNKKLGYLLVSSVDSATSAALCFPEGKPSFTLPTVFYAVEMCYPNAKVAILFRNAPPGVTPIEPSSSWKQVEKPEDANVTLKFSGNSVSFSWNGVVNDSEGMRDADPDDNFTISMDEQTRVMRMVRNAARFIYHLTRSPTDNSSLSFGVQLQQVNDKRRPSGIDILREGLAEVNVAKGENGPFCLVLHNNSKVAIWPFVFMCDPRFNILPWYIPHPAAMEAPLKPGEDLIVGENENGLQFQQRANRISEISYIKIFVTTERTSFSSLIQYFKSPFEDQLRGVDGPHVDGDSSRNLQSSFGDTQQSDEEDEEVLQRTPMGAAEWATMRITIAQKATDKHGK